MMFNAVVYGACDFIRRYGVDSKITDQNQIIPMKTKNTDGRSATNERAARATAIIDRSDEPPVLVVVDMMLEFKASRDPETQTAVAAEIRRAMAAGEAIIFVEYAGGPSSTYRDLLALVQDYKFWCVVEKHTDGGAEEVFEACMENGYWPENFRFVGVNADGCIFSTVEGLCAKLRHCHIEIVRAACHTDSGWTNWPRKFENMPNVAVV